MSTSLEDGIVQQLAAFSPDEYVDAAMVAGRTGIPSALRAHAADLYDAIVAFRRAESYISRKLDDVLELAQRFLYPEWFLANNPLPRYRAYTNVGVLNWYLDTVRRTPYQQIWMRCGAALRLLLDDLQAFEVNSLAGLEVRYSGSFVPDISRERVQRLRQIQTGLAPGSTTMPPVMTDGTLSWTDYVSTAGMDYALLRLTAFPQTTEHDEYLFLRAIHISECCFWGVLTATLATVESLKRGDIRTAITCLRVALPFATVLTPVFQTLKTMPPSHFRNFRDATGQASAVQSRTYQLMQIALLGPNPETIGLVAGLEDLNYLSAYDHPAFTSLAKVMRALDQSNSQYAQELHGVAARLDKELKKWRTLHLGIARNYLADIPEGTGGTSGASYLRKSVQRTIDAVEEALTSTAHGEPTQVDDPGEEGLWPEEHQIARRLSQTSLPYLSQDN